MKVYKKKFKTFIHKKVRKKKLRNKYYEKGTSGIKEKDFI